MSKLPAFQFYPGDWLQDSISGCSLAAQGLWLRMMFIAHNSGKYGYLEQDGKPLSPEAVARRCGCSPEQYLSLLSELDDASIPSRTKAGVIFSRRMVRDAEKRAENRMYQATHRKHHKIKKNSKTDVRPMSDVSSSSSSSSLSTNTKTKTATLASTAGAVPAERGKLLGILPLTGNRTYEVREDDLARDGPLFPAVDVMQAYREMKGWLLAHPRQCKTPQGIRKFINGWLSREQDKARIGGVSHGNRSQSKTGGNLDAARQAIQFLEQEERNREAADDPQPSAAGGGKSGDSGVVRGGLGASGAGGLGKCIEGIIQTPTP